MTTRNLSTVSKTTGAFLLVLALAYGLVPLQARAAQSGDTSSSHSEASSTPLSTADYATIAQAEDEGTCAAGQALVVYHASGAAKGATGTLSVQSDSDPLGNAGFSVSQVWDLSAADSSSAASAAAADGALSVQSEQTGAAIASGSDVRVAVVERDDMSVADLVTTLDALDFVECAAPNYQLDLASLDVDDTYANKQWGLSSDSSGSTGAIAGSTYGVDETAALSAESSGTADNVVAVLDTGVDYTNPDLVSHMWTNTAGLAPGPTTSHGYDAYNRDYDPMPGYGSGHPEHGTHCAGIIAAQADNGQGVAGVAGSGSHTKIMGLRMANDDGSGMSSSVQVASYEYMIAAKVAGVNVVAVNNSWGGYLGGLAYDPVLDYVVNQAGKAGIISCFAAGNEAMSAQYQFGTVMLESPYAIMVASSNEYNGLSSFTNYHETAVDVAAPGSNILSTLTNKVGFRQFSALLTKESGEYDATSNPGGKADKLMYYTNIADVAANASGTNFKIVLTDNDGNKLSDEAQKALSYTTTGNTFRGQDAFKVSIDYDVLKAAGVTETKNADGVTVNRIYATLTWDIANPFLTVTDTDPTHYAASVTVGDQDLTATSGAVAREALLDSNGTVLVGSDKNVYGTNAVCQSSSSRDNYNIFGGQFSALDTKDKTLTARVRVTAYDGRPSTGKKSCLVTAYGIGRCTDPTADATSAYMPYGYMSGTSMATPMTVGCVAELASLYPNYTPLQLRGLICGGTTPLASTGDQAKVASGGRFTFTNALDNSTVNANTWSITTSGDQVTVHGYNLQNAKLYVDDSTYTYATKPISQTASSITFAASSSLLDGKTHRFDVVDGTTGRTYKAAYVTPDASGDSLVRVHDLPVSNDAGEGQLISATDRLFLADSNGTYLYSCSGPMDQTSSWKQLKAPGTPWGNTPTNTNRTLLSYAYANGKLYAFATDDVAATTTEKRQAAVYYSTYDIARGSWSGFEKVGAFETDNVTKTSASAIDGTIYYAAVNTNSLTVFTRDATSGTFTMKQSVIDVTSPCYMPMVLNSVDGSLYGLSFSPLSNSLQAVHTDLARYDPLTGTLSDQGKLADYAESSSIFAEFTLFKATQTSVGNGFVIVDDSGLGPGKLELVDTGSVSVVGLGSLGINSASGLAVSSMTMCDGKLYLNCFDHTSSSNTVGLYTLPDDAASKLASTDVVQTAASTDGGTATVADWRDGASSELSVREGDTATWAAVANDGYTFAGWYDAAGNKVSDDAVYTATATATQTLAAHFTAAAVSPTPTPTITATPTPTVTGTVTPTPTVTSAAAASDSGSDSTNSTGTTGTTSGSGSSGVKTGDSTMALVLALLTLLAGGTALAIARRRSDW